MFSWLGQGYCPSLPKSNCRNRTTCGPRGRQAVMTPAVWASPSRRFSSRILNAGSRAPAIPAKWVVQRSITDTSMALPARCASVTDINADAWVSSSHRPMGFPEFVVVIASIMALNPLAMDMMLPALPNIASAFHITIGQPAAGDTVDVPDRLRRRPIRDGTAVRPFRPPPGPDRRHGAVLHRQRRSRSRRRRSRHCCWRACCRGLAPPPPA